jgi:calcium-dependent protein kinase
MAIGKECAVKIFRTGDPEIVNMIKVTFSNNRLLHDSKHVIKAHDLYINERKEIIHLVMEFCEFPSLENAMRKRIARPQIQKIIDEMA